MMFFTKKTFKNLEGSIMALKKEELHNLIERLEGPDQKTAFDF
jgi:hypothetical protein